MSTSPVLPNLEYLKYIEPHLATKLVEFILKDNPNEELKSLYKTLSIKTKNFDKISSEKFMSESELTSLKSKTESDIKDYEEKLKGFLNLAENCEKQKTHDLTAFSLGKKIIEQTSPIEIIQFSNLLFDTKDFSKASMILNSFSIFHENNMKTKSKAIYTLYLLFSLKVFSGEKTEDIPEIFSRIVKGVEQLKNIFDSGFKNTDFDGVDKEQVDFREILMYRGYLLHWALFLIKYDSTLFLDTLLDDKYFTLIESSFIYLIKYLVVFAIINGNRKYINKLKEAVSKKKNFITAHRDCFIFLLEDVIVYFNSENAKKSLEECKNMMKMDYFLYEYIDIFEKKVKEFMIIPSLPKETERYQTEEMKSLLWCDKYDFHTLIHHEKRVYYFNPTYRELKEIDLVNTNIQKGKYLEPGPVHRVAQVGLCHLRRG